MKRSFIIVSALTLSLITVGCSVRGAPPPRVRGSRTGAATGTQPAAASPINSNSGSGSVSTSAATISSSILPLGDGKVTTSGPRVGYVYINNNNFRRTKSVSGPWIDESNNTFNLKEKPTVPGSVHWNSKLTIKVVGDKRIISGNGLPSTPTGIFPIQPSTTAYRYDKNPNTITAHPFTITLPANPTEASTSTPLTMGPIGIMLTGAFLFNALDDSGNDAVAHEIQDACNGHPQRNGVYHFHNLSVCTPLNPKPNSAELVGYALDGFGIYVEWGANGKMLTDSDLDANHGRVSVVPWDGKMVKMYHYDITNEYPYTLGAFRGSPISFHIH